MAKQKKRKPRAGFQNLNDMPLDLTKDEKLRCAALTMAINYYIETICKDGPLYTAMTMQGVTFKSATVNGVVRAALDFEDYLSGRVEREKEKPGIEPTPGESHG
jgi:hypothetical protein